ncbi:polyphosphate kinase 2 [Methylophaga sp. OBS4]|uniref:polyphosphate kinase 2 n=1 Tax=Methylophaga sp. OBS4 TaxID=2991935 RepID=UPI00224E988A|nr:polyphosphate kinase 2 [Methylophaga sp. OBS4]MCX4186809.1 polyphosphate kinase 2 [Methylophaga sp. OBS4]
MAKQKCISLSYYQQQKKLLQIELLKVQLWARATGQRIVVLFEGRDASGKGGTIKRFMEHLNPRGARVVALEKPSDTEQSQWYFQRYLQHLPGAGEIVLFDRSWYNRAGVEKVMGFTSDEKYQLFLQQAPELERLLVNDGIRLFKYWFEVSRKEQFSRFEARRKNPLKHWKLSPIDIAAQEKWDEYSKARDNMFQLTHTPHSPWIIIKSDDKRAARINCMRHFLHDLPYPEKDKKLSVTLDGKLVYAPPYPTFSRRADDQESVS